MLMYIQWAFSFYNENVLSIMYLPWIRTGATISSLFSSRERKMILYNSINHEYRKVN